MKLAYLLFFISLLNKASIYANNIRADHNVNSVICTFRVNGSTVRIPWKIGGEKSGGTSEFRDETINAITERRKQAGASNRVSLSRNLTEQNKKNCDKAAKVNDLTSYELEQVDICAGGKWVALNDSSLGPVVDGLKNLNSSSSTCEVKPVKTRYPPYKELSYEERIIKAKKAYAKNNMIIHATNNPDGINSMDANTLKPDEASDKTGHQVLPSFSTTLVPKGRSVKLWGEWAMVWDYEDMHRVTAATKDDGANDPSAILNNVVIPDHGGSWEKYYQSKNAEWVDPKTGALMHDKIKKNLMECCREENAMHSYNELYAGFPEQSMTALMVPNNGGDWEIGKGNSVHPKWAKEIAESKNSGTEFHKGTIMDAQFKAWQAQQNMMQRNCRKIPILLYDAWNVSDEMISVWEPTAEQIQMMKDRKKQEDSVVDFNEAIASLEDHKDFDKFFAEIENPNNGSSIKATFNASNINRVIEQMQGLKNKTKVIKYLDRLDRLKQKIGLTETLPQYLFNHIDRISSESLSFLTQLAKEKKASVLQDKNLPIETISYKHGLNQPYSPQQEEKMLEALKQADIEKVTEDKFGDFLDTLEENGYSQLSEVLSDKYMEIPPSKRQDAAYREQRRKEKNFSSESTDALSKLIQLGL